MALCGSIGGKLMVQGQTEPLTFAASASGLTFTAQVWKNGVLGTATGTWTADGSTYTYFASSADTNAAVLYFLFTDNLGNEYTTGNIYPSPSPLTFETGWTLAQIIGKAQSRTDNLTFQPTGKFSHDWWMDIVNSVQSVVASEVGYKRTKFYVSIHAGTQVSEIPASLCKNIRSVWVGDRQIDVKTDFEMNESARGWRQLSGWPNQPLGNGLSIVSTSVIDIMNVIITGSVFSTGASQTETIALTGMMPVTSGYSDWGEVWTITLSEPCRGVVTISSVTGTIVTIPVGQTSATQGQCGTSFSGSQNAQPSCVVLDPPNMYWWPIPQQDATATIFASAMPVDLISDSQKTDSLPVAYQDVLVDGAVAMAELGDLYSSSQSARENMALQSFWNRVGKLSAFITSMSADRQEPIGLSPEGDYQSRFNRRTW